MSEQDPISSKRIGNREGENDAQKPAKKPKICYHCALPIHGQFVRATQSHYHLECFKCAECGKIVANKFFPVPPSSPAGKTLIYCETDYFKRLDLLCNRCGLALRGPYIRVGEQKYHMDHFSCSVCSTLFKQHDSYYEKDGKIFCAAHFSVMFAVRCGGCNTAVLKNFVETTKEKKVTQWHPCCYSLNKLWTVKMHHAAAGSEKMTPEDEVRVQKEMIEKVEKILHTLSSFEESTAACVTEMLTNFSNEHLREGASCARRLIYHIELLYTSLENVDSRLIAVNDPRGFTKTKEPRNMAKKIVQFFNILAEKKTEERLAATQDMILIVNALALLLKTILRDSISGAVRLEQHHGDKEMVDLLLQALQSSSSFDDLALNTANLSVTPKDDYCAVCEILIDEQCLKAPPPYKFKWHEECFKCAECSNNLVNSFQDVSFIPSSGSLSCKTHQNTSGVCNVEKVLPFTQYICVLNASWANLYVNLKIREPEFLAPDGHGKDLSQGSMDISSSNTPKNEEFFDEEDNGQPISSAFKSDDANRASSGNGLDWKITQELDDKTPYLTEISGLQLLATRQMAALALHRHMEKWFTLGKLLQIAEGPKTTIWSKMFTKKEKRRVDCTFGCPLDVLVRNYGVDSTLGFGFGQVRIPIFVQESISKLISSGMTTEGIFRKNGNIRRLKEQCEMFDNDPKNINFQDDNEIQVAALLKKFLRDLPEPLMTEGLYDLFLCVPKIERKEDQVPVIQLIMCLLPKQNIDLLFVLVKFFVEVSTNSAVHRMDLDNMATVIAPNILYSKINPLEHTGVVIDVIRLLFQAHGSIFKVPAAIKDSLASAEENPINIEFVKKYEQNLSKSNQKQASSGTHYSEGIIQN